VLCARAGWLPWLACWLPEANHCTPIFGMATRALSLVLLDLLKADWIALRKEDKQKVGRSPRCGKPDGLIVTLSNER
jgi:hypothetical protein